MQDGAVVGIVWLAVLVAVGVLFARQRRRRGRLGPGGYGAVYDLLNEDRRQAIEIVVEGRAEARDPEDRDGNLPDLENPKPRISD
jgi:MYXO-CTERM domain-containing protein